MRYLLHQVCIVFCTVYIIGAPCVRDSLAICYLKDLRAVQTVRVALTYLWILSLSPGLGDMLHQ